MKTDSLFPGLAGTVRAHETSGSRMAKLQINPKKVALALAAVMVFLLVMHLASVLLARANAGSKLFKSLNLYFNLNLEKNFPTFFSAALLMLAAVLLYFIYKISSKAIGHKGNWLLLALLFLFLALDEAIEIHERINHFLHPSISNDLSGYLRWIWVVPYALLFVAVAFYNLRFVWRLPKATRINFIVSGFVYVLAAAGIESLEGHLVRIMPGQHNVTLITTTTQEVLEMASIIFLIYGLLQYIAATFPYVQVITGTPAPRTVQNM